MGRKAHDANTLWLHGAKSQAAALTESAVRAGRPKYLLYWIGLRSNTTGRKEKKRGSLRWRLRSQFLLSWASLLRVGNCSATLAGYALAVCIARNRGVGPRPPGSEPATRAAPAAPTGA